MKLEEMLKLTGAELVQRLNASVAEGKITMKEYKAVVDSWCFHKNIPPPNQRRKR